MKVYSFLLILCTLLATPAMADTMVQGSARSTVNVETNIGGGSGNVSTHVETNVNGHVQNFNSTLPGSYHIYNNGNTSSVTNTSTGEVITGIPTSSPSASTSTPTVTIRTINPTHNTQSLWNKIISFIKSLLHIQ